MTNLQKKSVSSVKRRSSEARTADEAILAARSRSTDEPDPKHPGLAFGIMSRLVDKYDALTPRYRLGEEFGKFMLRLFRRQESAEAQQARDNLSIIGSLAAHGAVRITYPPRSSEIGVHTVVELPAVGDQQPSAPVECISYGIGGGVIYGLENEALRERAQLYLEVIGDIHNAAKEHGVAAHGLTRSLVFARGGYEGAA